MKKLFQIRNASTNKLVPDLFFADKEKAKAERDALNAKEDRPVFVVTPGPDHWKANR